MCNGMNEAVNGILAAAMKANAPKPGDYMGDDGLLHCGKCHEPRQYRERDWLGTGVEKLLPVACACVREERRRREERMKMEERRRELDRMRRAGFPDAEMRKWTFAQDDGNSGKAGEVARRYVANFPRMMESGKGLLLYGNVGTGKSFLAACIANALIDRGTPCLMTNFSRIVNQLQESFDGRQRYIDGLDRFDLLVIDDLAAERDTDYMWEQIMNVVDSRYRYVGVARPAWIVTEQDLREIRLLRVEADAVRELIRVERNPRVERRLRAHLATVEARRFELMRYVLEIPDARVRGICIMRFIEGRSWETIARRLHYERTAPGKVVRRWFARRG